MANPSYKIPSWDEVEGSDAYQSTSFTGRLRMYQTWEGAYEPPKELTDLEELTKIRDDALNSATGQVENPQVSLSANVRNSFIKGVSTIGSDLIRGASLIGSWNHNFYAGLVDGDRSWTPAHDYLLYQKADDMDEWMEANFPGDEKRRDDFAWTIVPQAFGSMLGFIIPNIAAGKVLGMASKAPKLMARTGLQPTMKMATRKELTLGGIKEFRGMKPALVAYGGKKIADGGSPILKAALTRHQAAMWKHGQFIAGAGIGSVAGAGQQHREAVEFGSAHNAGLSAFFGAFVGATEVLSVNSILRRASNPSRRWFSQMVRGGIDEALQETVSEMGYNAIAKKYYDETREIWDRLGTSGSAGGIVGATLGFASGMIQGRRARYRRHRKVDSKAAANGFQNEVEGFVWFSAVNEEGQANKNQKGEDAPTEVEQEVMDYVDKAGGDVGLAHQRYAEKKGIINIAAEDYPIIAHHLKYSNYGHVEMEATALGQVPKGGGVLLATKKAWDKHADILAKYPAIQDIQATVEEGLYDVENSPLVAANSQQGTFIEAYRKMPGMDKVPFRFIAKSGLVAMPETDIYDRGENPHHWMPVKENDEFTGQFYEKGKPKRIVRVNGSNSPKAGITGVVDQVAPLYEEGMEYFGYALLNPKDLRITKDLEFKRGIRKEFHLWLLDQRTWLAAGKNDPTKSATMREAMVSLERRVNQALSKKNGWNQAKQQLWADAIVFNELGYAHNQYGGAYSQLLNSFSQPGDNPAKPSHGYEVLQALRSIPGFNEMIDVIKLDPEMRQFPMDFVTLNAEKMTNKVIAGDQILEGDLQGQQPFSPNIPHWGKPAGTAPTSNQTPNPSPTYSSNDTTSSPKDTEGINPDDFNFDALFPDEVQAQEPFSTTETIEILSPVIGEDRAEAIVKQYGAMNADVVAAVHAIKNGNPYQQFLSNIKSEILKSKRTKEQGRALATQMFVQWKHPIEKVIRWVDNVRGSGKVSKAFISGMREVALQHQQKAAAPKLFDEDAGTFTPAYAQKIAQKIIAFKALTNDEKYHRQPAGIPGLHDAVNELLKKAKDKEQASKRDITPKAKELAEANDVDLDEVEATGTGGKITIKDVRAHIKKPTVKRTPYSKESLDAWKEAKKVTESAQKAWEEADWGDSGGLGIPTHLALLKAQLDEFKANRKKWHDVIVNRDKITSEEAWEKVDKNIQTGIKTLNDKIEEIKQHESGFWDETDPDVSEAPTVETAFASIKEILSKTLQGDVFARWIAPIKPISLTDTWLTLSVKDEFSQDWLEDNYVPLIKSAFEEATGNKIKVALVIGVEAAPKAPKAPTQEAVVEEEEAGRRIIEPGGVILEYDKEGNLILTEEEQTDRTWEEEDPNSDGMSDEFFAARRRVAALTPRLGEVEVKLLDAKEGDSVTWVNEEGRIRVGEIADTIRPAGIWVDGEHESRSLQLAEDGMTEAMMSGGREIHEPPVLKSSLDPFKVKVEGYETHRTVTSVQVLEAELLQEEMVDVPEETAEALATVEEAPATVKEDTGGIDPADFDITAFTGDTASLEDQVNEAKRKNDIPNPPKTTAEEADNSKVNKLKGALGDQKNIDDFFNQPPNPEKEQQNIQALYDVAYKGASIPFIRKRIMPIPMLFNLGHIKRAERTDARFVSTAPYKGPLDEKESDDQTPGVMGPRIVDDTLKGKDQSNIVHVHPTDFVNGKGVIKKPANWSSNNCEWKKEAIPKINSEGSDTSINQGGNAESVYPKSPSYGSLRSSTHSF